MKCEEGMPALWAITFGGEESVSLGEAELMFAANEVFAKKGRRIHRVETFKMPLDLLSQLARCPEMPIEKLRNTKAGVELVKKMFPGEETLSRVVPVRPVVELRLENETNFSVALWARASDG